MSRSRVSALSGVARWAAHLLLVGLALPALAVHACTRMPPVSDGSLRLRGGAQELKIEHRAFVANLPKTITDKGLREAFAPFGKIKQARVLKDIETGQSRRMGYVTFEDGHALTEAIEDMHEAEFCTTQVQEGEGRMLVVAVGENTYQGHMEAKMAEAEKGRSILQKKLDNMTGESVGCRPLTVRHSLVHTGSARGLIRTRQASAECCDVTSLCV